MEKTHETTTKENKSSQSQKNPVFNETESILEEIRLERNRLRILYHQKNNIIAQLQNQNARIQHLENKIKTLTELPAKLQSNK